MGESLWQYYYICMVHLESHLSLNLVIPTVKNYRPISLLSVVSKVHISKYIGPPQFGFIKHCSTLQQMLIFTDHIINSPLQTDVIYFDISKAFDTVFHSILLTKL